MTCIVQRTCREIDEYDRRDRSELPSRPVEEWKHKAAYVLLGPPGSGKTTVFQHESERQGGVYLTARDFLTLDDKPEWHNTILFIDGLDETRAGVKDGRTPLDRVRTKLDRMGRPRFRLSCREADWFGANDRDQLKTVSPDESITVLRLDPLVDQDIRNLLLVDLRVDDPDGFIATARERGLQGLLANPQSLRMLAVAVGADRVWPKARMQTFDMACRILLAEHNKDHLIPQMDSGGVSELMDISGRLCAIQLLTGSAGYSLSANHSDTQFLRLDQVPGQDRVMLRTCLQSKLFETPKKQCIVVPIHRQIAEFLAARYLAGLVERGLPAGRILALITGHDGVVISELRGLAAWLAAQSKTSRSEVIARDPLGAVLYGDASGFSTNEKRLILDKFQQESNANPRFIVTIQLSSRLGDLVSSDMEKHYREILTEPSREDWWQSFIAILIEALQFGERLPELAGPLMTLLRDETCWPRIRRCAVRLFLRHRENDADAFKELKALTADILAGKVQDSDNSLLARLLSTLYPDAIPETEIMNYLRLPRRLDFCPEYECFWIQELPKKSSMDQIIVLLDEFCHRYESLLLEDNLRGYYEYILKIMSYKLLAKFLHKSKNNVDLNRLFYWLGLVTYISDWTHETRLDRGELQSIRKWLEDHPKVWKTLLGMSLKGCIRQIGCNGLYELSGWMEKEERRRLFGAQRPPDFGLWCLEQAILAEDMGAARWLLGETAKCLHNGQNSSNLSPEIVSRRLIQHTDLKVVFDEKITELESPSNSETASDGSSQNPVNETNKSGLPNWREHVKPYEEELLENRASPMLLYELSKVYFGGYMNIQGGSPRERLLAVMAGDSKLVEAVLIGFHRTIERDDLPTYRQVIRLDASNRIHHLSLPFMAGLEEKTMNALSGEIGISERLARLALAVHYTVPMWPRARHPADGPPCWFSWLLSNRPDVIADVLSRSVLCKLRNGADSPVGLYELANDREYERVARIAVMPLLERFPVRCTSGQLSSLNHLLLAARRYEEDERILELIDEKHARPGMNVAQRVHWLTVGLCIAPEIYVDRLDSYVTARERRIRFLTEAVNGQFRRSRDPQCRLGVAALQLLIRLIGSSCRPYSFSTDSDEGSLVTPEMEAADRIGGFIEQLSAISTEGASNALETLSSNYDLRPWRSLLMHAIYRQNAVRREAGFCYSDAAGVFHTLDNDRPVNVADLASLTLKHLHDVARNIRDGNTSDWRQYWNVDGHNRPQSPRPENACRDALLSDLQNRLLVHGIDVQAEGRYADDKRSDIRVVYHGFNVPIEVKKSCHRNLWSAIRTQLIARYIRDPKTGGHGIYLVFWFGKAESCHPTPTVTGGPPLNARELEQRLTSMLSAEEQIRIRVCVVDVAIPNSD